MNEQQALGLVPMGGAMAQQETGLMGIDPAVAAAAAQRKAMIEAQFMMAISRPRNVSQVRSRIIAECQRPEFADLVEWTLPPRGDSDEELHGPTVRLAELAYREWGNLVYFNNVVHDSPEYRRVSVTVMDLQTNATFNQEITISKRMERRYKLKKRDIISERVNSLGEPVYTYATTDEELYMKEAAAVSRVFRNLVLRIVPRDLIDAAIDEAHRVLEEGTTNKPKEAMNKLITGFARYGVEVVQLEEYLGHPLDRSTKEELRTLVGFGTAIAEKRTTWSDIMAAKENREEEAAAAGRTDPLVAGAKSAQEAPTSKTQEKQQAQAPAQQAAPAPEKGNKTQKSRATQAAATPEAEKSKDAETPTPGPGAPAPAAAPAEQVPPASVPLEKIQPLFPDGQGEETQNAGDDLPPFDFAAAENMPVASAAVPPAVPSDPDEAALNEFDQAMAAGAQASKAVPATPLAKARAELTELLSSLDWTEGEVMAWLNTHSGVTAINAIPRDRINTVVESARAEVEAVNQRQF